jgi:hypothetical protein
MTVLSLVLEVVACLLADAAGLSFHCHINLAFVSRVALSR